MIHIYKYNASEVRKYLELSIFANLVMLHFLDWYGKEICIWLHNRNIEGSEYYLNALYILLYKQNITYKIWWVEYVKIYTAFG